MKIEAVDISKTYTRGTRVKAALENVSLSVAGGDTLFVIGPSGSGKTTLLSLLGLLLMPDHGEIRFDGVPVTHLGENELARFRRDKIGFVYQNFNLIESIPVLENIILPFIPRGMNPRIADGAIDLASRLGIRDLLKARPCELSGGECQRVALARALLRKPELLLADEPTGSLDGVTGIEIMELIRELGRERGAAIVIVTHERAFLREGDKLIYLRDGMIAPGDLLK